MRATISRVRVWDGKRQDNNQFGQAVLPFAARVTVEDMQGDLLVLNPDGELKEVVVVSSGNRALEEIWEDFVMLTDFEGTGSAERAALRFQDFLAHAGPQKAAVKTA